jgi:hypothetical protein
MVTYTALYLMQAPDPPKLFKATMLVLRRRLILALPKRAQ